MQKTDVHGYKKRATEFSMTNITYDGVEQLPLRKFTEDAYLNYSMSVIVSRALPDVRDGLKPVHRRVLYGASDLGATWNRSYKT